MIAVQIILIAIGALLADADECSCRCNKQDVCDEQKALRTKLDNNTDEFLKFGRYYNFVKGLAKDWEYQVDHFMRQQLEVKINKTVEGLRKEASIWKEDMIARTESLEKSVQALHENSDLLDLTMKMLSDEMSGLRTELHRFQRGSKCGVDLHNSGNDGRGNTSSILVWPWMAALYKNETSYTEYVCGGSVIHRRFVLTSAACVDYYGSARLFVKLGLTDLKNGTHLQEYRVQSTHMHPQFKRSPSNNYDYNIALLKLEGAISFDPFVKPVCLPPREIPQDEPFYKSQSTVQAVRLADYLSSPQTTSPTVLNLTIHPQEECRRKIKEYGMQYSYPSPDLSFCTESSPTCLYGGSPLMQSRRAGDGTETWTQVGIPSGCSDKYIISPRLDHLRVWVDSTIEDALKL